MAEVKLRFNLVRKMPFLYCEVALQLNQKVHCRSCAQGMVWNGMEDRVERKLRYGIWKMPEWNGMTDFKNGMDGNFHASIPISC